MTSHPRRDAAGVASDCRHNIKRAVILNEVKHPMDVVIRLRGSFAALRMTCKPFVYKLEPPPPRCGRGGFRL